MDLDDAADDVPLALITLLTATSGEYFSSTTADEISLHGCVGCCLNRHSPIWGPGAAIGSRALLSCPVVSVTRLSSWERPRETASNDVSDVAACEGVLCV